MKKTGRRSSLLLLAGIFILASAVVLSACSADKAKPDGNATNASLSAQTGTNLPRLQNFKSPTCPPCRAMEPLLEELSVEYAKEFKLEIVDVSLQENRSLAMQHSIQYIPTQIFYDANGKQLFRHTGFYSKEDILNKWKELGYDMNVK